MENLRFSREKRFISIFLLEKIKESMKVVAVVVVCPQFKTPVHGIQSHFFESVLKNTYYSV